MSSDYNIYEFGDFTIDVENEKLLKGDEVIQLEPMPFKVLLFLVKNPGKIHKKDEILNCVWGMDAGAEDGLSVAVNKIRAALKDKAKNPRFIENLPRRGYRFIAEVTAVKKEENSLLVIRNQPLLESENLAEEIAVSLPEESQKNHFPFIAATSFSYGLLFGIALLLESAYKFESFTPQIYSQAVGLLVWNGGIMFCALLWMQELLKKNKNYSVFYGSLLLCFGVFLSYLIVSYILPDTPVTLARFQSQPALAAFLKNEFYFLFLGVIFVLYPFYSVRGKQSEKTIFILSPQSLFGILILFLAYHIPSTFYLTDNLLPSLNQGFFVRLVFLRSFIYFGLGVGGLIWYFSQIGKGAIQLGKMQIATSIILVVFGLSFFLLTHSNTNVPQLNSVIITSKRDENNQIFVELTGENFQPNVVQVRVITPNSGACPAVNPCKVDNGALRKHSQIAKNRLENVPLTLPNGEYNLFVQNGESPMSNPVNLIVP